MKDLTNTIEQKETKLQRLSNNPRLGLLTDVGKKREVDEDSILAIEAVSGFESKLGQKYLLSLADGMGGMAKGEIASKIAVNTIAEKFCTSMLTKVNYADKISEAIRDANSRILNYSVEHSEAEGMGTTMVCAVVDGNEVHLGHVGDSRAYIISKEEIRRVTKDHSYVQELVDRGEITEEETVTHPRKNVITRAVGIYSDVEVDTMKFTLAEDEFFLLCCDGLIIHVEDNEIKDVVTNTKDSQEACQKLVDLANERGGKDNISIILLSPQDF